jgi:hypothetical protein
MDPTDTISTIEAARRLSVSKNTLARLIRAREIEAEKKTLAINSPYIVSAASVEAYRQKRRAR